MKAIENTMIVILADMGKIRALRLSPAGTEISPHAKPDSIEEIDLPHQQQNTDKPGRFAQGRSVAETAGMSPGENHNEGIEFEKRRIKEVAESITAILDRESLGAWCLAAPDAINNRLLALIPPDMLKFLATNLKADLTQAPLSEIEHRFPIYSR